MIYDKNIGNQTMTKNTQPLKYISHIKTNRTLINSFLPPEICSLCRTLCRSFETESGFIM